MGQGLGGVIPSRLREAHAVSTLPLGSIERVICESYQAIRLPVGILQFRNPHTRTDPPAMSLPRDAQLRQRVLNAAGEPPGFGGSGFRQKYGEFIPTEPSANIASSNVAVDGSGDSADGAVTAGVAERIVKAFQIVKINHEKSQWSARAFDAACLSFEKGIESTAIVQSRERISKGEVKGFRVTLRIASRDCSGFGAVPEPLSNLSRLLRAGRPVIYIGDPAQDLAFVLDRHGQKWRDRVTRTPAACAALRRRDSAWLGGHRAQGDDRTAFRVAGTQRSQHRVLQFRQVQTANPGREKGSRILWIVQNLPWCTKIEQPA